MNYQLAHRPDGSLAFWGVAGAYTAKPDETIIDLTELQFDALNIGGGAIVNGKLKINPPPVVEAE